MSFSLFVSCCECFVEATDDALDSSFCRLTSFYCLSYNFIRGISFIPQLENEIAGYLVNSIKIWDDFKLKF